MSGPGFHATSRAKKRLLREQWIDAGGDGRAFGLFLDLATDCRNGVLKTGNAYDIAEEYGWPAKTCGQALQRLHDGGLIEWTRPTNQHAEGQIVIVAELEDVKKPRASDLAPDRASTHAHDRAPTRAPDRLDGGNQGRRTHQNQDPKQNQNLSLKLSDNSTSVPLIVERAMKKMERNGVFEKDRGGLRQMKRKQVTEAINRWDADAMTTYRQSDLVTQAVNGVEFLEPRELPRSSWHISDYPHNEWRGMPSHGHRSIMECHRYYCGAHDSRLIEALENWPDGHESIPVHETHKDEWCEEATPPDYWINRHGERVPELVNEGEAHEDHRREA